MNLDIFACNFSNVNLSNNDFSTFKKIILSDSYFSNTYITIPKGVNIYGKYCDFSSDDLSQLEIDAIDVLEE